MRRVVGTALMIFILTNIVTFAFEVGMTTAGSVIAESGGVSGSWPMFRHDAIHSGYWTSIAPNRNSTKWIRSTGGAVLSSPAVVNGRVFIGSSDNKTYAVNEKTGTAIWNYTTGNIVTSSPAVANGRVFVGSYDKKIYALNETTGAFIWSYTTGASVGSSPTVAGGKIFVGSSDWKVYALAEATGALSWSYLTGGPVSSSPAIADGKVFVGSESGKVYVLDQTTGAHIWNYTTGGSVTSSPSVAGGRVFIGSSDGKIYALNANNGGLAWVYATFASVGSSPAVADGRVFIGSYDRRVYALNQTTGALLWSYTTGNYVFSSPAVADGKVFVGSHDNLIYALNETNGNLIWRYSTANSVRSSPAATDGMVFVGSSDGKIYAFGIHDVAIISVTPSKITVILGEIVTINVVVRNEGNFTEDCSVEAYRNSTRISTQITALGDGASTSLPFVWNTVGMSLGTYTMSASVGVLQDETDTDDNSYIDGTVKIIDYPEAKFTHSPTIPLANQTVTFNASISLPHGGVIASYSWNFGDGYFGSGMIVTHAYKSPADYFVVLNVTDSEGLSDTASKTIKAIWYPTAKFSFSPSVAIAGEIATFNASASTPNGGTILSYGWAFGDGKTGNGKIVTHNYTAIGNFNVILTVTDSEGLSNSTTAPIRIHARPTPFVYYYPTYPSVGELVTFNASFSFDLDGTIAKYDWNFSDGTPTVSGKIVTHYFLTRGAYAVRLTLTDNENITNTLIFKIGVETLVGDVNFDGKVDIKDVSAVAKAFGKNLGQSGYASNLDLNGDFKIDIRDVSTVAKNFGKTTP